VFLPNDRPVDRIRKNLTCPGFGGLWRYNDRMKKTDPEADQSKDKMLTWILAGAVALVAGAIGWVGWTCIDSVQKNTGKLKNYHVTADNTKIDNQHLDIVKNDLDVKIFKDKLDPSDDLQATLVKREGSEILYSKAMAAMDKKQFAQAAIYFSQVLALIPAEAKKKTFWYASGDTIDRTHYTLCVQQKLYNCYRNIGQYAKAADVVTEAIKLTPDIPGNYQSRAELYYKLGKKALGDADTKTARELAKKY
jgi:tetratricopeptide (TPR) repeat protein